MQCDETTGGAGSCYVQSRRFGLLSLVQGRTTDAINGNQPTQQIGLHHVNSLRQSENENVRSQQEMCAYIVSMPLTHSVSQQQHLCHEHRTVRFRPLKGQRQKAQQRYALFLLSSITSRWCTSPSTQSLNTVSFPHLSMLLLRSSRWKRWAG